jgi:hypothetical protein
METLGPFVLEREDRGLFIIRPGLNVGFTGAQVYLSVAE